METHTIAGLHSPFLLAVRFDHKSLPNLPNWGHSGSTTRYSNGHPTSDGLQPKSDGLQPNSKLYQAFLLLKAMASNLLAMA